MPHLIEAIYQTWLRHQDHREVSDAQEVRDGFAYYYNHFPDEYPPERVAIAVAGERIVSFAGVIPFPTQQARFAVE